MKYPKEYVEQDYVSWHEDNFPKDVPFYDKLDQLVKNIRNNVDEKINAIEFVLKILFRHCSYELKKELSDVINHEFNFPYRDLNAENRDKTNVFKSKPSIINKLWRKNSQIGNISFANIYEEINDFIRFSVQAPTYYHCFFLCERLRDWKELLKDEDKSRYDIIDSIIVDEEAKLASGYYAFHSIFKFNDGLSIEVQFYSEITESWRDLSHKFYELIRSKSDNNNLDNEWQQMVALGHLLKLVEMDFVSVLKSIQNKGGFT